MNYQQLHPCYSLKEKKNALTNEKYRKKLKTKRKYLNHQRHFSHQIFCFRVVLRAAHNEYSTMLPAVDFDALLSLKKKKVAASLRHFKYNIAHSIRDVKE